MTGGTKNTNLEIKGNSASPAPLAGEAVAVPFSSLHWLRKVTQLPFCNATLTSATLDSATQSKRNWLATLGTRTMCPKRISCYAMLYRVSLPLCSCVHAYSCLYGLHYTTDYVLHATCYMLYNVVYYIPCTVYHISHTLCYELCNATYYTLYVT